MGAHKFEHLSYGCISPHRGYLMIAFNGWGCPLPESRAYLWGGVPLKKFYATMIGVPKWLPVMPIAHHIDSKFLK